MTTQNALIFRQHRQSDQQACLRMFDANCPAYFAPNERPEYLDFLHRCPDGYEVCVVSGIVSGAFGVFAGEAGSMNLNWILLDPRSQGHGVGSKIMARVASITLAAAANSLHIAASHKSAPFFEKFGATRTNTTEHGWGPDMHRVDMILRYEASDRVR